MSETFDRLRRGALYRADDPDIAAANARAQRLLDQYDATGHDEQAGRDELLRELLGSCGEDVVVKPTFRCDLPAGVVAVGNPARVLREIDERDRVEVPDLGPR
ncbi:maltose acetyltransferase domain-containing protein [Egicoccus halophilus]|uniref:Acetyltransferase n=1 Tax=Egicoccus halophilus TaxID=1670830 RepID=A0A8J3A7J7_9ACTN|nr:maltose acetyltransferase domain-containing protein [Egicoccus halophilus]GGI05510.1 hypothetical protein GCM10011354_14460 [Egicoccus halophilus]